MSGDGVLKPKNDGRSPRACGASPRWTTVGASSWRKSASPGASSQAIVIQMRRDLQVRFGHLPSRMMARVRWVRLPEIGQVTGRERRRDRRHCEQDEAQRQRSRQTRAVSGANHDVADVTRIRPSREQASFSLRSCSSGANPSSPGARADIDRQTFLSCSALSSTFQKDAAGYPGVGGLIGGRTRRRSCRHRDTSTCDPFEFCGHLGEPIERGPLSSSRDRVSGSLTSCRSSNSYNDVRCDVGDRHVCGRRSP